MIVAMRTMREVQVPADHIVHMVAMWNGLVPTVRAMAMPGLMSIAGMCRGAGNGIFSGDGKDMFVDMVVMNMVEMAVVQVVGMALMRHSLVAAACGVTVGMMVMRSMGAHRGTPLVKVDERLKTW
jgi:hypothetical protein